jgi:hypothetical protein
MGSVSQRASVQPYPPATTIHPLPSGLGSAACSFDFAPDLEKPNFRIMKI